MLLDKEGQCKKEKTKSDIQTNITCTCSGESLMSVSSKLRSPDPRIIENNSGELLKLSQTPSGMLLDYFFISLWHDQLDICYTEIMNQSYIFKWNSNSLLILTTILRKHKSKGSVGWIKLGNTGKHFRAQEMPLESSKLLVKFSTQLTCTMCQASQASFHLSLNDLITPILPVKKRR